MKIAVEGCCHDELEVIYDTIEHIQKVKQTTIDLLLICGDFEATRNPDDLLCMAVPPKYRDMKYFYKYYKGEKKAPFLTLVIGGNHEASNHMQELPYGGWLAPNIYYLGYAGVVNVGGVRIGGMSGIYKGKDYQKGHFEKPPYSNDTLRSCYHTRSLEIFRLKQISQPVDIMLSHDWPLHAVQAGNIDQLLRWKPDFADEISQNRLGSPAAQEVLTHIKPTYWFSAHLHCKYPAVIQHESKNGEEDKVTKFLALDKCLPKRDFLQVLDVPSTKEPPFKIELDPEWLVILKNTNHLLNITDTTRYMPGVGCKERYDFKVTEKELDKLLADFGGDLTLPENFEITATPYDGVSGVKNGRQPACKVNPQTTLLCQMLGITDPFSVFCGKSVEENPDEIGLDIESEASETTTQDSEPEDGATTADSEPDPEDGANTTLDTTSGETFPTFLYSMSTNESLLNDSCSFSEPPNNPTSSTPARSLPSVDAPNNPTSSTPALSLPSIDTPNKPASSTPIRPLPSTDNLNSDFETNSLKSPQITPLSLPKPKLNLDSSEPSDIPDLLVRTKSPSAEDAPLMADTSAEPATTTSTGSTIKKFKRRNVAMYSILTSHSSEGDNSEST